MSKPTIATRPTHTLLSPEIADSVNRYHTTILNEVIQHVAQDDIVVIGMAWNPSVRKANVLLASKGYAHTYLEYGSYVSQWKARLSIKMWSGWPTFPQIFIKGILVGGYDDLHTLMVNGTFQPLLDSDRYE